jgi:hypothetical protein
LGNVADFGVLGAWMLTLTLLPALITIVPMKQRQSGQASFDGQYTSGATLWKLEAIARGGHADRTGRQQNYGAVTGGVEYTLFGIAGSNADLVLILQGAWDSRGQTVQQSTELFAHYGYSKTNIGDIAEACEMSAGNLYRYFRNKQAIGHAVVGCFFDELDACIERGLDPKASAEARIRFAITEGVTHTVQELRQAPKIVELSEMICAGLRNG